MGLHPENCAKVYDLWWREFEAMHDFGCCFVLTLHPWLSGRPSRVRLLEELVTAMQAKGDVWFARGAEIARYVRANPDARRELDFDHPELALNNNPFPNHHPRIPAECASTSCPQTSPQTGAACCFPANALIQTPQPPKDSAA